MTEDERRLKEAEEAYQKALEECEEALRKAAAKLGLDDD